MTEAKPKGRKRMAVRHPLAASVLALAAVILARPGAGSPWWPWSWPSPSC